MTLALEYPGRNMTTCTTEQLPANLMTPEYLGDSNRVHVHRHFLIPQRTTGWMATEQTTFTPRVRSLFRAYTEQHEVDLDFILSANGREVARDAVDQGAEKLVVELEAGTTYTFTINYYYNFATLDACKTWNLALAILPLDQFHVPVCGRDLLPPTPLY